MFEPLYLLLSLLSLLFLGNSTVQHVGPHVIQLLLLLGLDRVLELLHLLPELLSQLLDLLLTHLALHHSEPVLEVLLLKTQNLLLASFKLLIKLFFLACHLSFELLLQLCHFVVVFCKYLQLMEFHFFLLLFLKVCHLLLE